MGKVIADTTPDNVASQRTLTNAGFNPEGSADEFLRYAVELSPAGEGRIGA